VAYVSNDQAQDDIYVVRTSDPSGGRWQISEGGGEQPRWSRDGKAIFFRNGNQVWQAVVHTQPAFSHEKPVLLFEGRYRFLGAVGGYDVARDGRFLMVKNELDIPPTLTVVLNWTEEIRRVISAGVAH